MSTAGVPSIFIADSTQSENHHLPDLSVYKYTYILCTEYSLIGTFSSLLLVVIQLLRRLDALHIGAQFVDCLHPFVVFIRIEYDAAA